MLITRGTNWLKLSAGMAVAGAIVATAVSFTVPPRYESSAVLQVVPEFDPVRPMSSQSIQELAADHIVQVKSVVLSRTTLVEIITSPSLDLYKEERQRMPVADVVELMRKQIRIRALAPTSAPDGKISPLTFSISFAYPDRAKAQAVVSELVATFGQQNASVNWQRRLLYQAFWQDEAKARADHTRSAPPPPAGETLAVLDPASLPRSSATRDRAVFSAVGMGAGLLLGLLAALAMRRPRHFTLLGGFAMAGCVLAAAVSFLIPDRYTSTAVLWVSPANVTEDPTATPSLTQVVERLPQLGPEVLSRSNLARIIQKRDLYPQERTKEPLEDVIDHMRNHDIQFAFVELLPGSGARAFSFSYSYRDRFKATAAMRDLVTSFMAASFTLTEARAANASPTLRHILEHKAGENLELIDPPSVPQTSSTPNRLNIALSGFAAGLLMGALTLSIRRPRTETLQPA